MTTWLAACIVLIALGLFPALWVGSRGDAVNRLVGVEIAGAVTVLVLLAFSRAMQQSIYLIVPLVLAVLTVTGTLVYTRLLGPRP
ncbi:MAG TPA: monovalent cation/H+ antiporter complex subunit F [Mycobacteriales bacterium]|nr:monovalent cation/H+ antiporter complex subunit F [Mycobacteriales bacterium]